MRPRTTMRMVGLVTCAAVLTAGCGEDPARTTDPPQPAVSASDPSADEAPPGNDPSSVETRDGNDEGTGGGTGGGTTSATEELVLSQQVQLVAGGDGLYPQCRLSDGAPASFQQDPGVWLHELFSSTEYPQVVMLCLRGFSADQPLEVNVKAGDLVVASTVEPVVGAPPPPADLGYEDAPATTLFDPGSSVPVYTRFYDEGPFEGPPGVLASQMWTFVPPAESRAALASAGELSLTVTQGDTSATELHPIAVPTTRKSFAVDTPSGRMLVVHGYPAGPVPLGLYLRDESFEQGTLVRKAGTMRVPASRVGSWLWPSSLLDGLDPGVYCLLPPVTDPSDCNTVRAWPAYPGEAVVGDEGQVVTAWQQILIDVGVISDLPENHDGVYGPATQDALSEYLSLNGLQDPYDGGRLDEELYTILTHS